MAQSSGALETATLTARPRAQAWATQYAGTHEAAQFLGVSSQRVHQLAACPDA